MIRRLSDRQRRLRAARRKFEASLAAAIYQEFAATWPVIYREIRRIANQRPALPPFKRRRRHKILKSAFLGGTTLWERFRARLEERVTQELLAGTITLVGIYNAYQEVATDRGIEIIPEDLVEINREYVGQLITNMTDRIRTRVARRVTDWYNTPGTTLQELSDGLQAEFGERRARTFPSQTWR